MRRNNLFKDIDMALKNYLKRQESKNLSCSINEICFRIVFQFD